MHSAADCSWWHLPVIVGTTIFLACIGWVLVRLGIAERKRRRLIRIRGYCQSCRERKQWAKLHMCAAELRAGSWPAAAKISAEVADEATQESEYLGVALSLSKECPRDGKPDCSIVDALAARGRAKRANRFLSWVWGYNLSTAMVGLAEWAEKQQKNDTSFDSASIYIWWCFFCNNQYRLLSNTQAESTDNLAKIFGAKLKNIGKVLILFDSVNNSMYVKRIWCIFESFIASKEDVSCTLIVPQSAANSGLAHSSSIYALLNCCDIDAAEARASVEDDELAIKQMIRSTYGSFDQVNETVKNAVIKYMLSSVRDNTAVRKSVYL